MPGRKEQHKRNLKCSAEGCLKLSGYFKSRVLSRNENEPSGIERNLIETNEVTEPDDGDYCGGEGNEEDEIDLCVTTLQVDETSGERTERFWKGGK